MTHTHAFRSRDAGREIVVGVAEAAVSTDADDVLVTYALGSCIGLALFDPAAGVGGLLHSQLPVSSLDPVRAEQNPYLFTDTGVARLLQELFDRGASRRRIIAKLAGGAESLSGEHTYRVGPRNVAVARRVLWRNDIMLAAEDVGGNAPRTMFLYLTDGATIVRSRGEHVEL